VTAFGLGKSFGAEQFAAASGASNTEVMHKTLGVSKLSSKSRLCLSSHRDKEWKLKLVTSAWTGVSGLSVASRWYLPFISLRIWRQDHTAFKQANYRSIKCDVQVDVVPDLAR
jgi:hypothetical protein